MIKDVSNVLVHLILIVHLALTYIINGQMILFVIQFVHQDNITKLEIKLILIIKLNVFLVCLDVSYVLIEMIIVQFVWDKIMII